MRLKLAIVGRPNVGKSTLFNRLAGKRLAIVHDRPGVTRDRKIATGRLGDIDLELIDTAGLENPAQGTIEARMRTQTDAAIVDADLIFFVFDARLGITPTDEAFADLVRRSGRPVVAVANKCEGKAGDAGVSEAFSLGLGDPVPISAEHGEGMSDLYEAVRTLLDKRSPVETADIDEGDAPGADAAPFDPDAEDDEAARAALAAAPLRLAVVGRPNVGKSTLVNAILGEDRLITGPEPGLTRDAIAVRLNWKGREVRIHDTAGLRKRTKVQDPVEKLSTSDTIRAIQFAEVVVLLMDADTAFERQDLQIADLVSREGRAIVYAISKWDQVAEPQALLAALREKLERLLPQTPGAAIVTVSGLTGRGLDRLMQAVVDARATWSVKVKTRDLNDWLREVVSRNPPPAVSGRRIKPRYIAQTKSRPPTFVLLCSRADALPESYRRFLVGGIRKAFDLPGTPIRLLVRGQKNPYADAGAG